MNTHLKKQILSELFLNEGKIRGIINTFTPKLRNQPFINQAKSLLPTAEIYNISIRQLEKLKKKIAKRKLRNDMSNNKLKFMSKFSAVAWN